MKRMLSPLLALMVCGAILLFIMAMVQPAGPGVPIEGEFVHDLGIVRFNGRETTKDHTFRLTNRTRETLRIEEISRSCGCLSVNAPQRIWGPDETIEFKLSMILRGYGRKTADAALLLDNGETIRVFMEGISAPSHTLEFADGSMLLDDEGRGAITFRYISFDQVDEPADPVVSAEPTAEMVFTGWERETSARLEEGFPARYRGELAVVAPDNAKRVDVTIEVGDTQLRRVFYR